MRLSHSKLDVILSNPASYYLNYIQGIKLKDKPDALSIGSAVHWGIEHHIEDSEGYYLENQNSQCKDHIENKPLVDAMIHGYFYHYKELMDKMLTDLETGEKLELLDETHELEINCKLKSINYEDYDFIAIIDLLLLTEKGFIIIDYKTSSAIPDYDKYLNQIYKYIYALNQKFPDVPIYKIGIINLRKTRIKPKKDESEEAFKNRLKLEYEINDNDLINYCEFDPNKLDKQVVDNYIKNLSFSADAAYSIEQSGNYYINYTNATGPYGKTDYWDIFYKTPLCYTKYNIKDSVFDPNLQQMKTFRDCVPIDMEVLENKKVLNKYETYETEIKNYIDNHKSLDRGSFEKALKKNYSTDNTLLEYYWDTYQYKMS